MAVTFTRAMPVSPGDPIASRQLINLARAFNDRLRSGLGDGTWRIYFLLLGLVRQIRNPDALGNFPAADEFFSAYQHLDPLDGTWPDAAIAGQPEGINVATMIGAWVHGAEVRNLFNEAGRFSGIVAGTLGMDPVNGWEQAKAQRGAYDPSTGDVACPMFEATKGYDMAPNPPFHGLSYGSWMKDPSGDATVLSKQDGEMITRMLVWFVREFRGSDAQRSDPAYHLAEAADFQRILANQYHLSPQTGVKSGETVNPVYPAWVANAVQAPGGWVGPRTWRAGTAMTGFRVIATGLTADLTVKMTAGLSSEFERTVTVTPANPAAVLYFEPALIEPPNVRFTFVEGFTTGSVNIEATELLAYQPKVQDLYALLRVSTSEETNIPDGVGTAFDQSRIVAEEYFRTGCAVNPSPSAGINPTEVEINTNAPFDAMRRMTRHSRVIRRQEFTGIELVGGRTILWFKRTFTINGVTMRPWEGIESIVHTAGPNQMTNEWLCDIDLRVYDPDPGGTFKPETYSDYAAVINRCQVNSVEIAREIPLWNHICPGGEDDVVYVPESPSGWNYTIISGTPGANNANQLDCGESEECMEFRRGFYRSCRVYEPPVEIDLVEVVGDEVKVTLKGRLHHCPEAVASFARDSTSWDHGALRAESFRSLENGLREYLVQPSTHCTRPAGNQQPPAGNSGINAAIWENPDRPYGACFPKFHLTHLIPAPHEDTNDEQDPVDTHFVHDEFLQMELFIRAMAEGYVDGELSAENACLTDSPVLYDFTYPNLCQQAFGRERISMPLPNTDAMAATFNEYVTAVNLLTTVRVMLPAFLECNLASTEVLEYITAKDGEGNTADCTRVSVSVWADIEAKPALGLTFPEDGWAECSGGGASNSVRFTGNCSGGLWEIRHQTTGMKVRFGLANEDVREAIPESWRGQFEDGPSVLIKFRQCSTHVTKETTTDPAEATICFDTVGGDSPAFPDGAGGYLKMVEHTTCSPPNDSEGNPTYVCFFTKNLELIPGATPGSVAAWGYNGGGDFCLIGVPDPSFSLEAIAWPGQVPTLTIDLV